MKPKKVLIVDGKAVCYASYYGLARLAKEAPQTYIIYGFFSQIQQICRTLQIGHICFCWDSKKSLRKRMLPCYKEKRLEKDEGLLKVFPQFDRIQKELLPRLGFVNNFMATGYEADDLIAMICYSHRPDQDQQYIIATTDADLYQLLDWNISIYKLNKHTIFTKKNFEEHYGMAPGFWSAVKSMAGCSSDNVPGIPGVGEHTAIKYIREYQGFRIHPKIDSPQARNIILRNDPLVILPLKETPIFPLDWDTLPSYSAWLEICEELQFSSFLEHPKTWEAIFTGTAPSNGLDKLSFRGKRTKGVS